MWSVWADTVDVYLCRGIVWCRVPGAGTLSLRLPAALPLAAQLQRVSELLAPHVKKRVAFKVALGARLCPPVCYEVPQGLRWNEQQWMAQKAAALVWGVNPADVDQLVCVPSASTMGLAAALPKTTLDVVHTWASSHRAKVVSIAPMWAYWCNNRSLNQASGNGLMLMEPDGTPMLLQGAQRGCTTTFVDATAGEAGLQAHGVFHWSETLAAAESKTKRSWSWEKCFERLGT